MSQLASSGAAHGPGTVAEGRYFECDLFEGKDLGPWQKKTYLTPHMPPGITHEELFEWGSLSCILQWDFATMGKRVGADVRGMGPAMMAYFVKAAMLDRGIPAHVDTPVRRLIVEAGRVVGVEAEREGAPWRIRARKGVLLAIGGYPVLRGIWRWCTSSGTTRGATNEPHRLGLRSAHHESQGRTRKPKGD